MMLLSATVPSIPSVITRLSLLLICMVVAVAAAPQTAEAKVTSADIFGSHMVLQQNMDVPVWGTADAGEEVTVSFADQSHKTKADADGKWRIKLKPLKAAADQKGQPLTIAGSNTITFEDVLIGEVWLCSGQSNMYWRVNQAKDAKAEIANADYPQIRMFSVVPDGRSRVPSDKVLGKWQVSTPKTVSGFSAVAYYFGRKLHKDLNVPVGLIASAVGGTKAEVWTSGDAIEKHMPEFAKAYAEMVHPGKVLEQKIEEYHADQKTFAVSMAKLVEHETDDKTAAQYAAPDFDDSSWESMAMPGYWILKGLKDYEGLVWFRKTIDVPADWAGKDLQLNLGNIHAIDVTWFNGQEIGSTGSAAKSNFKMRNTGRVYQVPGKFVKAGKNVVAVRVISSLWRGGGFIGDEKTILKLKPVDSTPADAKAVSLVGDWRYLPVFQLSASPVNPEYVNRPSILFNGMIHPLIPYAIRGAT